LRAARPDGNNLSDRNWPTFLFRACLLVGLLYSIYLVGSQGIAAWYFRESSPEAIQAAIAWDPGNPRYYDSLANLMHSYAANENPGDLIRLQETAARLSPYDAYYWADLGAAYDWAGHRSEARDAFKRAQQLFPNSPTINWRLANFYIRAHDIPDGLRCLQKVLLGDSVPRRDVFLLATNATPDNSVILDDTLPPHAAYFIDYINFQIGMDRINAAEQAWARLLELNLPFNLREPFPYVDALIQHRELEPLLQAWSALGERFPAQIGSRAMPGNSVSNGNFEFEILNGGLDWRVTPVEGAVVSLDSENSHEGLRSLRIDFDGTHNLDYYHVLQFVPVTPSTRYNFSVHMRTRGITTDSGPRFQLYDAYDMGRLFLSSENLVGNFEWSPEHIEFRTGPETRLLVVRVGRPASRKFDSRIAGTVWISRVSLRPEK
jgi:tetratricopeptide (TPR) repeat protein